MLSTTEEEEQQKEYINTFIHIWYYLKFSGEEVTCKAVCGHVCVDA